MLERLSSSSNVLIHSEYETVGRVNHLSFIQILSRREQIVEFLASLGPLLISRFKEREESVKLDIIHAYTALLSQVHNLIPNFSSLYAVSCVLASNCTFFVSILDAVPP